jgi:hypothetical protein
MAAQAMSVVAAEGYITSVHPPTSFDVNGKHVMVGMDTTYGLAADTNFSSDGPLRNAVQVGAYVYVTGESKGNIVTAQRVRFRDDWDRKLSGLGVIDKVVATGAEPLFQADGFRIRVTPQTAIDFQEPLKTLAEVGPNIWLRYEGTRNEDGILVATRALFLPPKPSHVKAVIGFDVHGVDFRGPKDDPANAGRPYPAPQSELEQDAAIAKGLRIRWGGVMGRWHQIPADPALQARVRRIGKSLIPEYQKNLPESDSSKLHFSFYAVDEDQIRCEIALLGEVILVPTNVIQRLGNDDQLAAVLANGVAFNLQRQAARIVADNRALYAMEWIPFAGLPTGIIVADKINTELEEQRGRVALSLMADAGYDPWQAPEAWRLLGPKHLPADLNSLKYPSRSGYQLGILGLQYGHPGPAASGGIAAATDAPVANRNRP